MSYENNQVVISCIESEEFQYTLKTSKSYTIP